MLGTESWGKAISSNKPSGCSAASALEPAVPSSICKLCALDAELWITHSLLKRKFPSCFVALLQQGSFYLLSHFAINRFAQKLDVPILKFAVNSLKIHFWHDRICLLTSCFHPSIELPTNLHTVLEVLVLLLTARALILQPPNDTVRRTT